MVSEKIALAHLKGKGRKKRRRRKKERRMKKGVKKEVEVTLIRNIKPFNILKPYFEFQKDEDLYEAEQILNHST